MKAAPNPREIIGGKKFKCDTKEGKKCLPRNPNDWLGGRGFCVHCGKWLGVKR